MTLKQKIKSKGLTQKYLAKQFGIREVDLSNIVRFEEKYNEINEYLEQL